MNQIGSPKRSLAEPPTWPADESVRTLLSHRHNDVSDLKISTYYNQHLFALSRCLPFPCIFRTLVVRSLEVPDVFLLRDRSASRMANSFRQERIAELFDEES